MNLTTLMYCNRMHPLGFQMCEDNMYAQRDRERDVDKDKEKNNLSNATSDLHKSP